MASLTRAQEKQLQTEGVLTLTNVPVEVIPKRTFYTLDRYTKALKVMPNLPADERNLQYYLDKGFRLTPQELGISQTVTPKVEVQEGKKFVCKVCGKPFDLQRKLAGHSNKHRKVK